MPPLFFIARLRFVHESALHTALTATFIFDGKWPDAKMCARQIMMARSEDYDDASGLPPSPPNILPREGSFAGSKSRNVHLK